MPRFKLRRPSCDNRAVDRRVRRDRARHGRHRPRREEVPDHVDEPDLAEGPRQAPRRQGSARPLRAPPAPPAPRARTAPTGRRERPGPPVARRATPRCSSHRRCRSSTTSASRRPPSALPSGGIYCIAAPPGADPNGVLIVSPRRGANVGFVTHSARTVCNANEYQVSTVDPDRRAQQHDLVRHPRAVRFAPAARRGKVEEESLDERTFDVAPHDQESP